MKKIFLFIAISFCFLSLTQPAFAYRTIEQNDTFLDDTVNPTGISTENIQTRIGAIIAGSLKIVGTLFFGLMIYGGFLWMTAHGEEEPITKAKNTIFAAIIGLAIIISAFAITNIVTKLTKTGPTGAGMSADGTPSLSPSAQSAENMTTICDDNYNRCTNGCNDNAQLCLNTCSTSKDLCYEQRDNAITRQVIQDYNQTTYENCQQQEATCRVGCRTKFPDLIQEQTYCIDECHIDFSTNCGK
jgi:hypothetical protein